MGELTEFVKGLSDIEVVLMHYDAKKANDQEMIELLGLELRERDKKICANIKNSMPLSALPE